MASCKAGKGTGARDGSDDAPNVDATKSIVSDAGSDWEVVSRGTDRLAKSASSSSIEDFEFPKSSSTAVGNLAPSASRLITLWLLNPLHLMLFFLLLRLARRTRSFIQRRGASEFLQRRGWRFYLGCCLYSLLVCFDPYPGRGGYPIGWLRNLFRNAPWWRWLANYFPMKIQRTAELDSSKKYIFVCHPHGILGFGTWLNFGMNPTGVAELFPGIRLRPLAASAWFWLPIIREFSMLHGFGSVRRQDVLNVLKDGKSAVINVGGAREALDARPGTFRLQLRRRKGFIKCAQESGAQVVPVISFGENELYGMHVAAPGTSLRWVQEKITSLTGSTVPLFCGLSWLPAFPRRSPITTVVGEPMDVDQDDVESFHERYMAQVSLLFERHKSECGFPDLCLEMP